MYHKAKIHKPRVGDHGERISGAFFLRGFRAVVVEMPFAAGGGRMAEINFEFRRSLNEIHRRDCRDFGVIPETGEVEIENGW